MKILSTTCISDTHGWHDNLKLPGGDLLIHSGDACFRGTIGELNEFALWFLNQPYTHKIFVPGNHDFPFEKAYYAALASFQAENVNVLLDRAIELEGLVFYGSPWTPYFQNWAFNLKRGYQLRQKWAKIPEQTDILITHGPPRGVGDLIYRSDKSALDWENRRDYKQHRIHVGCKDLWERVQIIKPQAHIFGHIHVGRGLYEGGSKYYRCEETTFVNAAVCNVNMEKGEYFLNNEPIEIFLTKEDE